MDRHAATSAASPEALAHALEDCEVALGAAWAWNPARWGTRDGGVSYHAFLDAAHALGRTRAAERLHLARAVRMGMGGEPVKAMIEADERAARGETG